MRHKRRRQNVNMWRTADENRQPRLRESARWRSYCGRTALHAWLWIKHDSLYRFAVPPNVYTKKKDLCLYIVYNNTALAQLSVWNMGGKEPPSLMLGNGEDNILKKGQCNANPAAHWSVLGLLPSCLRTFISRRLITIWLLWIKKVIIIINVPTGNCPCFWIFPLALGFPSYESCYVFFFFFCICIILWLKMLLPTPLIYIVTGTFYHLR